MVSVRPSRIEALVAEGNKRAKAVMRVLGDITSFISACQFGITVASLVLGWLGEETLANLIDPALERIMPGPVSALIAAHTIATMLALAIVTYLHLLLGNSCEGVRWSAPSVAMGRRPWRFLIEYSKRPSVNNQSGVLALKSSAAPHGGIRRLHEEELRRFHAHPQDRKLSLRTKPDYRSLTHRDGQSLDTEHRNRSPDADSRPSGYSIYSSDGSSACLVIAARSTTMGFRLQRPRG